MADAVRERIVQAARHCFAQNGLERTTVADICREAGVACATVYRHFPGKEALFAAAGRPEPSGGTVDPHRRMILDAALDLFSRQGFQSTTVTDIAEAAAVARATVYAQFSSKEAILHALIADTPIREWTAHLAERVPTDPQRDLETLALRYLELHTNPRRLAMLRVILAEGSRFVPLQRAYHQVVEDGSKDFERYLLALNPGLPDPAFTGRMFFSALLGFVVQQQLIPGTRLCVYTPEAIARQATAELLHGILPRHPAEADGNGRP